ncbi:MAG: hypothetical protein U1E15_11295 [Hyphomicrobiales bacterium]
MAQDPTVQFNDGEAYERLMGRWSRKVGADFISWCAVPPGMDWLDVGCGNGAFTEEVMARACLPRCAALTLRRRRLLCAGAARRSGRAL